MFPASINSLLLVYVPEEEHSSHGHTLIQPWATQVTNAHSGGQNMMTDSTRYVSSCMVCAQAKVLCTLLCGKLMPLATPQQQYSHLAIDFIMDLSETATLSLWSSLTDS